MMASQGVVHGGVIVLDDPAAFPEGTRVDVKPAPAEQPAPVAVGLRPDGTPMTFGDYFRQFQVDSPDSPTDLADQHDHYRLGTPKR